MLDRICRSIRDHISENSHGIIDIQRMMVTFKVDPQGRAWLLWLTRCDLVNEGYPCAISADANMSSEELAKLPFGYAAPSQLRNAARGVLQGLDCYSQTF